MINPLYISKRDELIANGILTAEDIYKYSDDELLEAYNELFKFANDHLEKKEAQLRFPPTYIIFHNDSKTNAYASSAPKFKIIGILRGAVENMYYFFEQRSEVLNKDEYQSLHSLARLTNNSTYVTIYQLYTLFLYYHEYAHLIQHGRSSSFYLDEISGSEAGIESVLNSHGKELDAD